VLDLPGVRVELCEVGSHC